MQNDQNLTPTSTTSQALSQPTTSARSQLLKSFRSNLFNNASVSSDKTNLSTPSQPQPNLNQNPVSDLDILDEVISEIESQPQPHTTSQSPLPISQSASPSTDIAVSTQESEDQANQPQIQFQNTASQSQQPSSQVQQPITQSSTQQPVVQLSAQQPITQSSFQQPVVQSLQPQIQSQTQPQLQPQIQSQEPQALQQQPLQPPQSYQDPSILSQALPLAVTQVADQQAHQNLNPPSPSPAGLTGKEKIELKTPDGAIVDATSGIQVVEQEPNPELPPEVDGFLKKAEDQHQQSLQEIVIADGSMDVTQEKKYPTQPVVVLPITEEVEDKAKFKNPSYSIKWLVEWSHKMIKKFVGKVIYRQN